MATEWWRKKKIKMIENDKNWMVAVECTKNKQPKINNETAEENIYKKIQAVGTCLQLKY